ncbi:MAG: hypothetical protein ACLPKT_11845 [Methylocella sp.]
MKLPIIYYLSRLIAVLTRRQREALGGLQLARAFVLKGGGLQTFVFQNRRIIDGQKIETPRLDNSRCLHVKDTCEKENAGEKHCPNLEA